MKDVGPVRACAIVLLALTAVACSSHPLSKTKPDGGGQGGQTTGAAGSGGAAGPGGASGAQAGVGGADAQAGTAGGADAEAGTTGGADAQAGTAGANAEGGADVPQETAPAEDAIADGPPEGADAPIGTVYDVGGPEQGGYHGPLTPVTVDLPHFSVPAGGEMTQCYPVGLELDDFNEVHFGEIKATLGAVVYELRVGALHPAFPNAGEDCPPFDGADTRLVKPLLLARNRTEDLKFPAGVGFTLPRVQYVLFEVHAWNPGSAAADATASVTFTPMADSTFQHEAGLVVVEDADVHIVPGAANVDSGRVYVPLSSAIGATSITRVMGYTHGLGVDVSIATARSASDPSPTSISGVVYDPSAPAVVNLPTPVALPASGGIDLECVWSNPGGQTTVLRGPSVHDERCAAVLSYYPAPAIDAYFPAPPVPGACFHTSADGGADFCCPGGAGCP
jgi:hypothetical protein